MSLPYRIALKHIESVHPVLVYWGLEGLLTGQSVTLYHGTTASFKSFDSSQAKQELVKHYTGTGIFLTPDKSIARLYSYANRNIGIDPKIILELKRKNPKAGDFLQDCYDKGQSVWDVWFTEPDDFVNHQSTGGVDPNSLSDLSGWILGSNKKPLAGDDNLNIFNPSTGMPDWVYDLIDDIGLDSFPYRPKIYTVSVTVSKTLVTDNKNEAKKAFSNGYECFVYYGSSGDLVRGVPEIALPDGRSIHIKNVELS